MGFQSLVSQNPFQSVSISYNPYGLKITEQTLKRYGRQGGLSAIDKIWKGSKPKPCFGLALAFFLFLLHSFGSWTVFSNLY
jgi:hypothetical protein